MLLRLGLGLARRPLVAATHHLGLGLAGRLGIARRRRPAVALTVHGRGVGAAVATGSTLAATTALAPTTAATASLGKEVFGDLRLGKVVLLRRDRRESRRPAGHADLRVPDRTELVRARGRRGCRQLAFFGFDGFAFKNVAGLTVLTGLAGLGSAVTATPATAATAAATRRLAVEGLAFGSFHEFRCGLVEDFLFERSVGFGPERACGGTG
jgi:hypothetical protein